MVGPVAKAPVAKKAVARKVPARKAVKAGTGNVVPVVVDKALLNSQTPEQLDEHFAMITAIIAQDRYNRTLESAKTLIKSVYLYFGGGRVLGSDMIIAIGEYLKNESYYYYAKKDFDQDPGVKQYIKSAIEIGFKFNPGYSMHLMQVHHDLIDPIMKTYNNTIDHDFLQGVETKEMTDELMTLLIDAKKIKIQFTPKQRDIYMNDKKSNSYIICALLDDPTVVITPEFTKGVAKYHKLALLRQTILSGGVLDSDVLNSACSSTVDRYEKVKFILDNKIEPTQEAFNTTIGVQDEDDEPQYYRRRRYGKVAKKGADDGEKGAAAVINLFTEYGYVVSYDDLKAALKKSIVIKNVERFNIKFDATYLHICSEIGMYPYKTKDISPDLTCLANECKKTGNLTNIKKVTNDNKLTPDSDCMHEACKHKSNLQTLKFLVLKGGRVDFECLKNIIGTLYNRTLNFILEEYEKNNTSTLKDIKDVKVEKVVAKGKGVKKAKKDASDSEDMSDDDSDDNGSDYDSDEEKLKKKPVKAMVAKSAKKKTKYDSDDSDEDTDSEDEKPKPVVKATAKATKTAEPVKEVDTESVKKSTVTAKCDVKVEAKVDTKTVSKTSKSKKGAKDSKDADLVSEGPNNMVAADEDEKPKQDIVAKPDAESVKPTSQIPKDFSPRDSVYNKIPMTVRKLLKLTLKNKSINYVEFRRMLLEYLNDNEMIVDKVITVKAPLLYNGSSNVPFKEINEWAYSVLNNTTDTKKGSKSDTKEEDGKKSKTKVKKAKKDVSEEDAEEPEAVATILDIDDENENDDPALNSRRARRATASKNKKPVTEPEKVTKGVRPKTKAAKQDTDEDAENDDEDEKPKKGTKKVVKGAKTVTKGTKGVAKMATDTEDEEKSKSKSKSTKKAVSKTTKTAAKPKTVAKKTKKGSSESDNDEDDTDDEVSIPVKKTAIDTKSKAKTKTGKTKVSSKTSDDEEPAKVVKKTKAASVSTSKTAAKTTSKVAAKVATKTTSAKKGASKKKPEVDDADLVMF